MCRNGVGIPQQQVLSPVVLTFSVGCFGSLGIKLTFLYLAIKITYLLKNAGVHLCVILAIVDLAYGLQRTLLTYSAAFTEIVTDISYPCHGF